MMVPDNKIAIRGIGCVGAFGCGVDAYVAALQRGYSAARQQDKKHPDGSSLLPAMLADTEALSNYVPKRSLRRIDHYARMALLGGYLALEDAAISTDQCEKLGVIVASGYGAVATTLNFLDSVLDDGDSCASPTSFSNSLHNVAAAYLSMQLQAFGPSLTVSQFELSMCSALQTAACWLKQGRVDTVLIGGVDEYTSLLNDYCWRRLYRDESRLQQIDPFAFDSHTAIAGEGAAFLVLSSASETADSDPYAYISALDSGDFAGYDNAGCQTGSARPKEQPLIIGADGQRDSGKLYAQLAHSCPMLSCAPCYGSLPVGQAFDVAAAALMLRDQSTYGVSRVAQDNDICVTAIDSITTLKIAPTGHYGRVTLSAGARSDA